MMACVRRTLFVFAIVSSSTTLPACALEERTDFLVGRACEQTTVTGCDPGQSCLPHALDREGYTDYRCRDRASFEPIGGREAPLAYCDDDKWRCPGNLVCNADRVRVDATTRRRVCKRADDIFSPPIDGGA